MRSCSDTDINPLSLYSRERGKKKIVILWYDIFCLFDEALFSKLQTRSWRQSIETNKIMRKNFHPIYLFIICESLNHWWPQAMNHGKELVF